MPDDHRYAVVAAIGFFLAVAAASLELLGVGVSTIAAVPHGVAVAFVVNAGIGAAVVGLRPNWTATLVADVRERPVRNTEVGVGSMLAFGYAGFVLFAVADTAADMSVPTLAFPVWIAAIPLGIAGFVVGTAGHAVALVSVGSVPLPRSREGSRWWPLLLGAALFAALAVDLRASAVAVLLTAPGVGAVVRTLRGKGIEGARALRTVDGLIDADAPDAGDGVQRARAGYVSGPLGDRHRAGTFGSTGSSRDSQN